MGEGRTGIEDFTPTDGRKKNRNRGFAGEKSRAMTALRDMRLLFCSFWYFIYKEKELWINMM
jgi:hypothetical protein